MASGPRITIGSAVNNVALTATNSTTFTYSWSTSGVSAGSYTVTVTGTDLAGNTYAGSDSIKITLDSTAPIVTLSDTDDDNLLAASDTVTITASFSEAMTSTPTISIANTSISNEVMTKIAAASGTVSFTQLGVDIDGNRNNNIPSYGGTVDLSSDGTRVVIGDPQYSPPFKSYTAGRVRVYDFNGNNWVQVGGDLLTSDYSYGGFFGNDVEISSDGSRIAASAPRWNEDITGDGNNDANTGRVRIYDYTPTGTSSWTQIGGDIRAEDYGSSDLTYNQRSGESISLSSDGSTIAIGGYKENVSPGIVRIFRLIGNTWTKIGGNLVGENNDDEFGTSMSLSPDGTRVAIGAPMDENSTPNGYGGDGGYVRVYDYNGSAWVQVGDDIEGVESSPGQDADHLGRSVSLSSDGTRLAIGATRLDGGNGHVRIYDYTPSGVSSWTQVGVDLQGSDDNFGINVSLSSDGSRLAIAEDEAHAPGKLFAGRVLIYDYTPSGVSSWTQVEDIYGEAQSDRSGKFNMLSLSADGSTVAIGAPNNGDGGDRAGHVRVFSVPKSESYQYAWDVDSGGAPSDGTYAVTVAGSDLAGNAYSGTDSITFTLDTTAPTVTLTDTDSDNLVSTSEVVTITAGFSEAMTATPTISITGIVTNVIMTPVSGTNSYTFRWDTSSGTLTTGNYAATVSGTDLIGNAYVAGTQSITFTVDSSTPTVTITTNDPDNTIKPGDNITVTVTFNEPMASGPRITIGSAVSNLALTATNSTTFTYSWSTSGVSAGSYTVTVTGTDLAGNTYAGSDSIEITLDSTEPTVTLSDTDDDNFLAASDTVAITAAFNEAMTSTPTISISGTSISNQEMSKIWVQVGADIDGEAAGDESGRNSISLSSDGSRLAIGGYLNDGNGTSSGHVRIYDYNGSAWVQVGADIDGEAANDYSGWSVSLSSDGSRVAIGAYRNGSNSSGHVRIYQYNNNSWSQLGADIDGEALNDSSGISVSLSSDGSRVAIGAHANDGNGSDSGHVRIYQYNNNSWSQLGADIDGEAADDASGLSISLSSDGSRVAIGAYRNDGNGSNSGHVRIYQYNNNSWSQLGADIDGEAVEDQSGYSVSLSSDGSRVAIGAGGNDGNGSNSGHVRIYDYNGSAWVQVGADIDGEAAGDYSGWKVSLSSDGSRVAIGANNNDGGGTNSGHVRIYQYNNNSWSQLGADIDGEAVQDQSGRSISLSSDGSRMAIGAPFNDGNGSNSGHVRVYSISSGGSYQYLWDVDSGGAPSDGTYRATVAGADKAGNAYSGTDSITFTLDTSAPTVTLTDTDADNIISTTLSPTNTVTITASFSKSMAATPTIFITGVVTNVAMTRIGSTNNYTYNWNTSTPTLVAGAYSVTVSGTDAIGNAYVGTDSITFTISPTFYLDANGVTVKCRGCSAGDTGMVSGTIYTAHDNTSLANKDRTNTDWDRVVTTLVTDMSGLFDGATGSLASQNRAFNQNLSSWDTSNVTDMSDMFKRNISLSSANQNFNSWDTSKVTDMSYMFEGTDNMNPQIDSWDVSSVTNMESMFQDCRLIGYNNTNQAIGSWDVSSVTNMRLMFNRTDYFNIDIGSWDTSSVTDMTSMFYNALEFNQNIGGWDTSNVTNMSAMFNGARRFNQYLNSWDVSKVTSIYAMFESAAVFNGNISSWDTSSVTNMSKVFESASRFNQDIGNWNVSNVTNMSRMFTSAADFVQDISGWCVSQIGNEPSNFKNSAGTNSWRADTSKHPQWGTCPAPQVTLTDTDADNYVLNSSVVSITATFSAAMSPTATISIGSVINSVAMTVVSSSTFRYVWDVDAGGSLADAVYSATVSGVDTNGRAYIGTDSITFTLLSPPSTPSSGPDLSVSSDKGPSNTDNLTNVTTPTFTGTVTPSTGTVYLYAEKDGGSPSIVASVTTASDGSYTISPTSALTSGGYVFYVRIENAAGDTSGNSPPLSVTVQTTPTSP